VGDPIVSNIGHMCQDVGPWIWWGNSPDDTTQRWDRAKAFIGF
jgi:hypothetical protein